VKLVTDLLREKIRERYGKTQTGVMDFDLKSFTGGTYQASFRFDERSVLSVHFVIKTTRVAQVMTGTITTPQRCRRRSTVDALTTFWLHTFNNNLYSP